MIKSFRRFFFPFSQHDYELAVVGAGLSGIAAAKFYLDIHPECRLVMLEQDSCIGGVWSRNRLYDNFWTQWTVGTAAYPDKPMDQPPEEDTFYDFFRAKYTTGYLEKYVDEHAFAGQSMRDKIRFSFKVHKIEKQEEKWTVFGKDSSGETTVSAPKLIVASGVTSSPNMPDLLGQDDFQAPIMHQESFGRSSVLSSPDVEHVTVLGGSKSSADMVYTAVKAGKSVSWVIRDSGTGPGFFVSTKGKGPYKNALEIGTARVAATLSPSLVNPDTWSTRFLYGSSLGRKLVELAWGGIDKEIREEANYARKDVAEGFERLDPHTP